MKLRIIINGITIYCKEEDYPFVFGNDHIIVAISKIISDMKDDGVLGMATNKYSEEYIQVNFLKETNNVLA